MPRRFAQVDVFAATALGGNPVAVVLDAEGLDPGTMHQLAAWTNLSETTFVLPATRPEADYAVRIFTPERELPFAGHPTLGTCHAWLEAGGRPRDALVVQECGVGLVPIRRSAGTLAFAAPPRTRSGPLPAADVDLLVAGLGLAPTDVLAHQWCDNGPPWQALWLSSVHAVLAVRPDPVALAGRFVGLAAAHPAGAGVDLEVRAFFPAGEGLAEDPVTGSLGAALGQWLIGDRLVPEAYVAAQGTALGRAGRVRVSQADGAVWVGGGCHTLIRGSITL